MDEEIDWMRNQGMSDDEIADGCFWNLLSETGYDDPYMQMLLTASVLVHDFDLDEDAVADALASVCSQMSIGPGA